MKTSIKIRIALLIVSAMFLIMVVGHVPHLVAWAPTLVALWVCANSKDFRLWAYKMSVKYVRLED